MHYLLIKGNLQNYILSLWQKLDCTSCHSLELLVGVASLFQSWLRGAWALHPLVWFWNGRVLTSDCPGFGGSFSSLCTDLRKVGGSAG
jgi:hypothetical protein